MSLSDNLAVIGIAVSIFFGLWGIYLTVRKVKYPANLTFVREQSVALLEDFAQKVPNLSVLYKGIPINENVVLISGYMVNDGALDITREMTEESLTCSLPNNSTWLEFKVTTFAPALHVSSALIDERSAKLDFGLFRRDESFSFQALALLGDVHTELNTSDLADKLIWSHRISSLGEVKTLQMPPKKKTSKVFRGAIILAVVAYVFMGFSLITGLGPLGKQPSIIYTIVSDGNRTTVRLIPKNDGSTTVKDEKTGTRSDVNLEIFVKTNTLIPSWTDKRDDTWTSTVIGWFMVFASILLLYVGFYNDYRRYKLRKFVAVSKGET